MKSRIAGLCLLLTAALFLLASCSDGGKNRVPSSSAQRILQDAKALYKEASLVATGKCESVHTGEDGENCSDVRLTEIIAGSYSENTLIHCMDTKLDSGSSYLMFLSDEPQRLSPDKELSFTSIGESLFKIKGGKVSWYDYKIKLESIMNTMRDYNDLVTVPGNVYMYSDVKSLLNAADEIIIARVLSMHEAESCEVKSYSGTAARVNTAEVIRAEISVNGSIKGMLKCEDEITLTLIPENIRSMLDAATLETVSYPSSQLMLPKEGEYYIFFLISSVDGKQTCYFPLNPVQGWVRLKKDDIQPDIHNEPLYEYGTLEELLNVIKNSV